jgi:hypothetical protein
MPEAPCSLFKLGQPLPASISPDLRTSPSPKISRLALRRGSLTLINQAPRHKMLPVPIEGVDIA